VTEHVHGNSIICDNVPPLAVVLYTEVDGWGQATERVRSAAVLKCPTAYNECHSNKLFTTLRHYL